MSQSFSLVMFQAARTVDISSNNVFVLWHLFKEQHLWWEQWVSLVNLTPSLASVSCTYSTAGYVRSSVRDFNFTCWPYPETASACGCCFPTTHCVLTQRSINITTLCCPHWVDFEMLSVAGILTKCFHSTQLAEIKSFALTAVSFLFVSFLVHIHTKVWKYNNEFF